MKKKKYPVNLVNPLKEYKSFLCIANLSNSVILTQLLLADWAAAHLVIGYPVPKPKCNEALIRVTMAGICNTDLEIINGYMDFKGVPGHEFVGIVEKSEEKKWEGKRVAGEINIGCGFCYYCLSRMKNHCPNRSVLGILKKDGAFADYITLPVRNLHAIPDSVSNEEAVFMEPIAASFQICHQIKIKPSDKICVLGDGKLGILAGQVLFLTGCNLTVIGHHEEKLSILSQIGIHTSLNEDINGKFDVVVDCTGSPSGLKKSLALAKPKGKVILKTTLEKREPVNLNAVVINEIDLIGSRCGPFAPATRALQKKLIDTKPLISKTYYLDEGMEAFKYASQRGVLKVILKIK